MKPSEVAKNMQAAIDLLTKQLEEYLAAHPDAIDPAQDEWPQIGCMAWFVGVEGDVDYVRFDNDSHDKDAMAIGNCFRTEAEARRHVEALKVQAELRRMPGRCQHNPCAWFISPHNNDFLVVFNALATCNALAGVYFVDKAAACHARETIGQDRLRMWLDDYLQTPMEGGAV